MELKGYAVPMDGIDYTENSWAPHIKATWPSDNVLAGVAFEETSDGVKKHYNLPVELILLLAEKLNAVKQRQDLQEVPF